MIKGLLTILDTNYKSDYSTKFILVYKSMFLARRPNQMIQKMIQSLG